MFITFTAEEVQFQNDSKGRLYPYDEIVELVLIRKRKTRFIENFTFINGCVLVYP